MTNLHLFEIEICIFDCFDVFLNMFYYVCYENIYLLPKFAILNNTLLYITIKNVHYGKNHE